MFIDFEVYENSNIEPLNKADILQGESNITILRFMLPQTIRGYDIANYTQEIKFESEKGEILRFNMTNGQFALTSQITDFKSVRLQLVLTNTKDESEPIIWRTKLIKYDFIKSINAEYAIGD